MAKFHYDFDPDPRRSRPQDDRWGRRVRIVLLFCTVAAITAAVVYALIPSRAAKPVSDPAPGTRSGAEVAPSPGEGAAGTPKASEAAASRSGSETAGSAATASADVPSAASASAGDAGNATASPPIKGRPDPGDPAPDRDVPQRSGSRDAALEHELRKLLNDGDFAKFFPAAEQAVAAAPPDSEARAHLGQILTDGRNLAWLSGKWRRLEPVHKVVNGDNLSSLARRYHTTVHGIKVGNKLKTSSIMIGQKLTLIPGPWRVTVAKKSRLLTLYRRRDGKETVFAVFSIGIGRNDSTPTGKFVLSHRRLHPVYRDPHGRVFAYGDARNPLGEAFLALALPENPAKPYRGYGIHGTTDNTSVGRSVSHGCVRMRNEDVRMLYSLLPPATPVEITD